MNWALWDENSEEEGRGGGAKGLGNISCPQWVKCSLFTHSSYVP